MWILNNIWISKICSFLRKFQFETSKYCNHIRLISNRSITDTFGLVVPKLVFCFLRQCLLKIHVDFGLKKNVFLFHPSFGKLQTFKLTCSTHTLVVMIWFFKFWNKNYLVLHEMEKFLNAETKKNINIVRRKMISVSVRYLICLIV